MMRRALFLLLLIGSLPFVKKFCYEKTDGFSLYKIVSSLAFNPAWEMEPLSGVEQQQLSEILDQPYFYLARGAQSFVFLSQDGETVIKFLRLNHSFLPFWLSRLHLPPCLQAFKLRKWLDKRRKLERDFQSYAIAYRDLRQETGLVYLHLNKTHHLNKRFTFYDKLKIAHEIDLDQMEFIVQKRASLVYPTLEALLEKDQMIEAREAISGLVQLLALRCAKGIADKDPDIYTNFGFIGTAPLQIDIGRFSLRDTQESHKDEIIRATDDFRKWLEQRSEPLARHLMNEIDRLDEAS